MSGKIYNRKKQILKLIARLLLVIGAIGWFIPTFGILNYDWLELPNSFPQGLHVDDKGNLFCGSRTYERIQMYDKHAKFIRAFDTDVGKGRGSLFTFKVENNQLHIHVFGVWLKSERLDRKIVYALDGSLLDTTEVPSVEYAGYNVINEAYDSIGNYYSFKGFFWPRVTKKNDEGSVVIISTPLYFWLFQSPFPAFAFFFISLLYLIDFKKNILRPRQITSSSVQS